MRMVYDKMRLTSSVFREALQSRSGELEEAARQDGLQSRVNPESADIADLGQRCCPMD